MKKYFLMRKDKGVMRVPRIERVCAHCKAQFFVRGSVLKKNRGKYCSKQCQKDGRKKQTEVKCNFCGKAFTIWPCEVLKRNFCTKSCYYNAGFSESTIRKMSDVRKGRPNPAVRGSKCHFWRGGITPRNKLERMSLQMRVWRESVFKRDNYTCMICGQRGGNLNADHIKPFALFPQLRFAIDNGRTLCISCHRKTDTYGRKGTIREYEKLLHEA